ncbi:MAG: hypothetical protein WBW84_02795 [Acidobacteriaceae bacterium]
MHVSGKRPWRPGKSGSLQTSWTTRQISRILVLLVAIPLGGSGFAQQAPPQAPAPEHAPATEVASTSLLPMDVSGETTPDAPQPQNAPPSSQQQTNQQQPAAPQPPLGTAAAPYEQPSGITASRPAGAAIAPAKQRRTRTILISVGVLVATAVAVGTVMGLSRASPSTSH